MRSSLVQALILLFAVLVTRVTCSVIPKLRWSQKVQSYKISAMMTTAKPLHLDRGVPQDFLQLPVTDWVTLQDVFKENVENFCLLACRTKCTQQGQQCKTSSECKALTLVTLLNACMLPERQPAC